MTIPPAVHSWVHCLEYLERNCEVEGLAAKKGLGWYSAHLQERLHSELDHIISRLGRQKPGRSGYGEHLKRAIVAYNRNNVHVDIDNTVKIYL